MENLLYNFLKIFKISSVFFLISQILARSLLYTLENCFVLISDFLRFYFFKRLTLTQKDNVLSLEYVSKNLQFCLKLR